MPLWRIWHPADFYTPEEKAEFSKAITDIYNKRSAAKLPRFYVVVIFTPYNTSTDPSSGPEATSVYVGGEPRRNFIRIVVEQIARRMDASDVQKLNGWTGIIEEAIAPWVKDKGKREGDIDWELHIAETSRDLWRINGFIPPMPNSEGEVAWREANRPIPF